MILNMSKVLFITFGVEHFKMFDVKQKVTFWITEALTMTVEENFGSQMCLGVEKEDVNTDSSGLVLTCLCQCEKMWVISERQYPPLTSSHNQHVYILPQKRCESVGHCVSVTSFFLSHRHRFNENVIGRKCRPSSTLLILTPYGSCIPAHTHTHTMIGVYVAHCHT